MYLSCNNTVTISLEYKMPLLDCWVCTFCLQLMALWKGCGALGGKALQEQACHWVMGFQVLYHDSDSCFPSLLPIEG